MTTSTGRSVPSLVSRSGARLLGRDDVHGLLAVGATFVVFAVLDRWTGWSAQLEEADLGRYSLTAASIEHRWWLVVPLLGAGAAAAFVTPRRMAARWSDLQHGTALHVLAGILIALLAWQASLYPVNFLAGQVHGLDRTLVAILAVAAIARPIALVPFVLVVRIVNEQFVLPFGTVASKNVDELLLLALLAIAAGHLLYVVTGRRDTSPVLLIIGSAVAAHFFWPGKAKLVSDWVGLTDVSNLPLSSYTAGWLGSTDGGFSRSLADFYGFFRVPVLVGTLVIEVGAILAVVHPKVLRIWIGSFVLFHTMTFVTTGFFFIGWTLLELGVAVLLWLPRLSDWREANATPARGLIAIAAVLGGTVLYHPPGLAWFDAPVSYGYEIDAVGESGDTYHIPISTLAPLDQDVSFARIQLADHAAASGGYGALSTAYELGRLEQIGDFSQLAVYEAELGEPAPSDRSQRFFLAFYDHVNDGGHRSWFGLGPPDRFWTSRPEPVFDFDEPLARLEVSLVASIHGDDGLISRRQLVLAIETGADGDGVVVDQPS